MRSAIAINGSFFNTQRMMAQYVLHAYFTDEAKASPSKANNPNKSETQTRIALVWLDPSEASIGIGNFRNH
jgi:hypothetical protein